MFITYTSTYSAINFGQKIVVRDITCDYIHAQKYMNKIIQIPVKSILSVEK